MHLQDKGRVFLFLILIPETLNRSSGRHLVSRPIPSSRGVPTSLRYASAGAVRRFSTLLAVIDSHEIYLGRQENNLKFVSMKSVSDCKLFQLLLLASRL